MTPILARAAAAVGPFTLSDSNRRVSQFSTIDQYAGDAPSLPMLALVHYASTHGNVIDRIRAIVPPVDRPFSETPDLQPGPSHIQDLADSLVRAFRDRDTSSPVYQQTVDSLARELSSPEKLDDYFLLTATLTAASPPPARYLNYSVLRTASVLSPLTRR